MRLNILRRGEGLGGRGLESGFGGGRVGAFMICLLWGTTALGMKIDTRQLGKREPEPQRARVTEWITVTMQGGWRVTEYSTTTITPTATAKTAIVTMTSIITTGTTVTNTVTATTTTVTPTIETTTTPIESTAPTTATTTSTAQIATTSTSTSTPTSIFTSASASQIIETTSANINTIVATTTTATTGAGTPVSQSGATSQTGAVSQSGAVLQSGEIVAAVGAETPPAKNVNIATITDIVTGAPLSTNTVIEIVAPTTTTKSWGQGAPVLRRQDAQETITLTATNWDWTDGVTTSVVTVYATPTNAQTSTAAPMTVTTTMISTQVSTWTTQQTVTATATPSASATAVPSSIAVDDTPTIGGASPKTPNVEVIVGACFGALVGFIGIFVLAYLWSKKRRDENLRKESVGFSNGSFLRSSPGAGSGVRGMIGSLRRGPSTRYNNIPSGESMPNMSPLPVPPHSPPPQLPQLRVMPPSGEFNYEYTFGSPVSSIGEAQLHALTSGAISPPVMENQQDELFFSLPRQESEQPPWSSPVVERVAVAETVVSSVSAQSAQSAQSNEPTASTVSGSQSPTRKPVPTAADYLVSP